jgi:hypothetical protein
MEWYSPSVEEMEKLELRVINAMIDVYNKILPYTDNGKTNDEIKIIFETIKAGHEESKKIRNELREAKKGEYEDVHFHPDLDQLLLSCVAGGIIYHSEGRIEKDGLSPYNLYGYQIRSLIMALKMLDACNAIDDVVADTLWIHDSLHKQASRMMNIVESDKKELENE